MPACLCVLIFTCVFVCTVCVRAVSLSEPTHPVPACPAFRQLPDQPWGFLCNLLCIPTAFNGCTGISFRANCPNHSSTDAAMQTTRTVLDSEGSGGVFFPFVILRGFMLICVLTSLSGVGLAEGARQDRQ